VFTADPDQTTELLGVVLVGAVNSRTTDDHRSALDVARAYVSLMVAGLGAPAKRGGRR
jgi:hypothetical protein